MSCRLMAVSIVLEASEVKDVRTRLFAKEYQPMPFISIAPMKF